MAFSVGTNLQGIGRALERLAPLPQQAFREWVRLLRTSSRGMARLSKSVPVHTGRLSRSWGLKVSRGTITVFSDDPAVEHIRYKRKRRYGATTPRGTLKGWSRKDATALGYRAINTVIRRQMRRRSR